MKYFTKEWYYGNKDVVLDLEVNSKAGEFSEEYYNKLYNDKLKEFLEMEKEVSEMEYEPELWEDIQFIDDEGNLVNARDVMSDEEFEALRQEILEDEKRAEEKAEKPEPYDEEELTKTFLEIYNNEIEELKENLPKEILEQVADIRVLALGESTEKVKELVEEYSAKCEAIFEKPFNDYNEYWYTVSDIVPQHIKEDCNFHDCQILEIKNVGDDLIFELDNSGGFTNIKRIIYKDAKMIESNFTEGCYWIYDEIYLCDKGYEFHIAVDGENGYEYITLRALDMVFEY